MELNVGSIPALIARQVAAYGGDTILRKKDRGIWKATTWAEFDAKVREIGQSLLAIGFGKGDVAAVLSDTRPEFAYADLAILGVGGAAVAIHPEEQVERIAEMMRAAGCRVVFVENEEQLDKVLSVRASCPALARVVIFDMKGLREFRDPQCISLQEFITGSSRESGWTDAVQAVTSESTAALLYSHNENGMVARSLTHGDVMHMLAQAQRMLELRPGDERLAVLSMSDVTERVLGLYLALSTRVVSNYLEGPETAIENLREVQPTIFGADAAFWEQLHARIGRAAAAATPVQRALYNWAIRAGRSHGARALLADLLVLRAVRRELGLKRLRLAYVGGRPAAPDTNEWARSLGVALRRVDHAETDPAMADERYRALIEDAYAGA